MYLYIKKSHPGIYIQEHPILVWKVAIFSKHIETESHFHLTIFFIIVVLADNFQYYENKQIYVFSLCHKCPHIIVV